MNKEQNEQTVLFTEPEYTGWDDCYRRTTEDKAWGEQITPYLPPLFEAHLGKALSVADFGSGDGRNSALLVEGGRRVTLVDVSPTGLELAAKRFTSRGIKALPTLVRANLEGLPLAASQFDAAICIDAFPQVRRPRQALEEMGRTLTDGGILILNVFTPKDCAFGEGEQVGPRSFLYKNTLFNFYEDQDFRPLVRNLFDVLACMPVRWEDPPHIPFRPYPHTHDGLAYVLIKQ